MKPEIGKKYQFKDRSVIIRTIFEDSKGYVVVYDNPDGGYTVCPWNLFCDMIEGG